MMRAIVSFEVETDYTGADALAEAVVERINEEPEARAAAAAALPSAADFGPQRSNETPEQYAERIRRVVEESGVTLRSLPDGARYSTG